MRIYQPEKGRRVAPLLVEAIRVALELDPSLTFYLYGSDAPVPISDHRVVSLGLISTDECRELTGVANAEYRSVSQIPHAFLSK